MFSVSDIKEETYQAVYRRGKELYEANSVWDFSYDIYLENEQLTAEITAKVQGNEQPHYPVTVVVNEDYAQVANAKCTCEAFYNYEGMCKHCVAALLTYVNRRQAKDILRAKEGQAISGQDNAASEKSIAVHVEDNNYEVQMLSGSQITSDNLLSMSSDYDTFILTTYNDASDVSGQVHTISITCENGKYELHNASGETSTIYNSLEEAINGYNNNSSEPISVIGVR